MKETTGKRLRHIMAERNLKQVDILHKCEPYCEKYGIKLAKNDLSQYISDKVQPKQDKLSILGMALGVSEAWLMGYDVPMKPTAKEEHDAAFVKRAVRYYKQIQDLPPEKRKSLEDYLSFLQSDSDPPD